VEQHSDEPATGTVQLATSGRIDVHAHLVPPNWREVHPPAHTSMDPGDVVTA
jgi:hypothetical protein